MATTARLLTGGSYIKPPNRTLPSLLRHDSIHLRSLSFNPQLSSSSIRVVLQPPQRRLPVVVSAANQPLDLTEENVEKVLVDARVELAQLFDSSVGITGQAQLAELDGPFVKIRLTGRFWHKRSTVLARLDNYLRQRIPEILEVDIEDEKQLDDSPANF